MSSTRIIISKVLLVFSIFFTALALLGFAMPFIAAATGSYEGGEQAIGGVIFYLLLGFPAFLFGVASVLVRGWREARTGYVILLCLIGVPTLTFVAALIHATYDSIRK